LPSTNMRHRGLGVTIIVSPWQTLRCQSNRRTSLRHGTRVPRPRGRGQPPPPLTVADRMQRREHTRPHGVGGRQRQSHLEDFLHRHQRVPTGHGSRDTPGRRARKVPAAMLLHVGYHRRYPPDQLHRPGRTQTGP
jgi:hypothetical protein